MTAAPDIPGHYTSGDLLARLEASLREDGVDPARPTIEALAPYDHFHGRGLDATEDLADLLQVSATDHLLDVGSGLGGPARYMARRFGCRVGGIDLTAEFCDVARHLTSVLSKPAASRCTVPSRWSTGHSPRRRWRTAGARPGSVARCRSSLSAEGCGSGALPWTGADSPCFIVGGTGFSDRMIAAAARRAGADVLHTFDRRAARLPGAVLLAETPS